MMTVTNYDTVVGPRWRFIFDVPGSVDGTLGQSVSTTTLGGSGFSVPGGGGSMVIAGFAVLLVASLAVVMRYRSGGDRPAVRSVEHHRRERHVPTDREYVIELLEQNDGRMKQSAIVDAVDWSKAKVSRLLADLEADGDVVKIRLGRENLICRPGQEPTASRTSRSNPPDPDQ